MAPRVIRVDPYADPAEAVQAATASLRAGRLVGLPTETVYGIAADAANPEAVARLRAVKRRDGARPLTLHLADAASAARYVDAIPEVAQRLMERFWPGPLTIVIANRGSHGVGLRVPGHHLALDVIRDLGTGVFLPSANRAGCIPATTAPEVVAAFGNDDLDLVLDAGPTAIQQASSVIRVDGRAWALLREGAITGEMIRRVVTTTLLFICTGNSCRSPMAEALCRRMLADRLGVAPEALTAHGFQVLSAGTAALKNSKATLPAVKVMRDMGCDITGHAARPITRELVDQATWIFTMNDTHSVLITDWMPEAAPKIHLLRPEGICDPIGHPIDVYQECANVIRHALERVIAELLPGD